MASGYPNMYLYYAAPPQTLPVFEQSVAPQSWPVLEQSVSPEAKPNLYQSVKASAGEHGLFLPDDLPTNTNTYISYFLMLTVAGWLLYKICSKPSKKVRAIIRRILFPMPFRLMEKYELMCLRHDIQKAEITLDETSGDQIDDMVLIGSFAEECSRNPRLVAEITALRRAGSPEMDALAKQIATYTAANAFAVDARQNARQESQRLAARKKVDEEAGLARE
ncbi:hypothetical protein CYMTET_33934 [Cymbomonas tetramitiformis]|uniref:Uncharacterized protein n=1 Tax=Cymbomonas tetramitiformis TaxID=36881 RepID=A0AAE0FC81_9CHLO|nr:hypothetical protein CYMTET_33934 [Cymbomonas tetramitiformis]